MGKFSADYPAKSTPVDNDKFLIADSAAANAIKHVTKKSLTDTFLGGLLGDTKYYATVGSGSTWTKPAGLKYVVVEVQAGGGGGGGSSNTNAAVGGGGGGGGYVKKRILAADLPDTVTVTIGGGGGGGSTTGNGGTGGDSSFGTLVQAGGGGGGQSGSGSFVPDNNGSATGGDLNMPGQPGSPRRTSGAVGTGTGGGSFLGRGAQFIPGLFNEPGTVGVGYGSGGGGACRATVSTAGGAGAQGIVIVHEYF